MMKKSAIMICLLLCLLGYAQAKERVIERPPFVTWSSRTIEIDKVVLSDTATVLYIKAYYRPKYWIKIASTCVLKDNNGKVYPIRQGVGITPGKEFWMPESGEGEFQLIFPPLPDKVTSVDFLEEIPERPFNIYGIQLKGDRPAKPILPKGAVIHKIDNKASLPQPETATGTATLKGKLLDYRPGMVDDMTLDLCEPVKGYSERTPIVINPDGSFSWEAIVMGTTPTSINLLGKTIKFFLAPGQTSELVINMSELCRQQAKLQKATKPYGELVYINGPLENIAQELNQEATRKVLKGTHIESKDIEDMDTNAYKVYAMNKYTERLQRIEESSLSKALKQLMIIGNEINTAQELEMVASMLTQAKIEKNEITREEAPAYYDKLKKELPDDYYHSILNFKSINTPVALLCENYRDGVYLFSHMSNKLEQAWGTNQGVFFDVMTAMKFYQGIKDFTPLSDEQKIQTSTLPPAYKALIEAENVKLLAQIEANKKKSGFSINEAGEVSNEDLFASIVAKFRGKVVLVDFWATWCGPCRMANKAMIPMKESLKNQDVVYIYLAGENSPLGTWKNMITDIHGEHYRVTDAQWKYLMSAFKIDGVPTYILVDREGAIVYKTVGFPGVDTMKTKIFEALNKKN